MIKTVILSCLTAILVVACFPQSNDINIKNAYMAATPKTFPAAAIFLTIENNTDQDDRMVGFKTDRAKRVELHTMALVNDVMRMRQVEGYDVPSGHSHELKHMGDHIMLFDMVSDFTEGETFNGIAIFEKSGEIPVEIHVKNRKKTHKNHGH